MGQHQVSQSHQTCHIRTNRFFPHFKRALKLGSCSSFAQQEERKRRLLELEPVRAWIIITQNIPHGMTMERPPKTSTALLTAPSRAALSQTSIAANATSICGCKAKISALVASNFCNACTTELVVDIYATHRPRRANKTTYRLSSSHQKQFGACSRKAECNGFADP